MYRIADGKTSFERLLDELEPAISQVADLREITSIGVTCGSINGWIAFSANRGDTIQTLKNDIPIEFEFSWVLEFSSPDSPMAEWKRAYWENEDLVTEAGTVVVHAQSDSDFAAPILKSVCQWMDGAFREHRFAKLRPIWLIVDEVEGCLTERWRVGELGDVRKRG